jgi:hypothetical protein
MNRVASVKKLLAVYAGVALSLAGCEHAIAPIDSRSVAAVSVSPGLDTIAPDDTLPFAAELSDSAGHAIKGVRTVWSTSDPSVATVDSTGRVRGVAPGVAEIAAIAAGARGSADVVVRLRPARVVFTPDTLGLGDVVTLAYKVVDAAGRTVPYPAKLTDSDTNTVAIRNAALESRTVDVVAAKMGTVTFTALVEGHAVTGTLTIGQAKVIGVAPMQTSVIVPLGATRPLFMFPYVGGGALSNVALTWTSTDPATASVDGTGIVTPHRIGAVTVRGESQGFSATTAVRVFAYPETPKFVSVVATSGTACALSESARAYCWGLATGTDSIEAGPSGRHSTVPVPVQTTQRFTSLATGPASAMCGVATDGSILCWTGNAPPTPVVTDVRFVSMSHSSGHSCALTSDGAAYCWGKENAAGQLGTGAFVPVLTPTPVVGGLTFTSIAVLDGVSCGLTPTKALFCWGSRDTAPGRMSASPLAVGSGLAWQTIKAGVGRICGITTAGVVYCWTSDAPSRPFESSRAFAEVSPGGGHTCFLDQAGVGYCNGSSQYGALGTGTLFPYGVGDPLKVAGDLHFKSIAAGSDFSCAVTMDGVLYCWGRNTTGQVGAPSLNVNTYDIGVGKNLPGGPKCNLMQCLIGGVYAGPQKVLGQP